MAWPGKLQPMSLPVIGAPLFIISNPLLVIEQCKNGVIGAFPALNARPQPVLGDWLDQITTALAAFKTANPDAEVAPFAVNQIIHASNDRLGADLDLCESYRVPIVITSLSAPGQIVPRVHSWGGLVFHDVIGVRHAKKAIEAGVDGLILVCAGAGGHAGTLSPFALTTRCAHSGKVPSRSLERSRQAAVFLPRVAMGADFAYVGTRFIASEEANADPRYKQMITASDAADILYSDYFTGVPGNYLRRSVINAGLDPDHLPPRDKTVMNFEAAKAAENVKAWRDIWGAGQSVGAIEDVLPAAAIIARMRAEYGSAKRDFCGPDGRE